MLEQRSTVISEKKKSKERENAFEEGERAAKLDGKGELDEQGELSFCAPPMMSQQRASRPRSRKSRRKRR